MKLRKSYRLEKNIVERLQDAAQRLGWTETKLLEILILTKVDEVIEMLSKEQNEGDVR